MQDLVRFLDRQGEYKEMHIVSTHYIPDADATEQIFIELAGIDDSVIISLGEAQVSRLIRELMTAQMGIRVVKDRKHKEQLKHIREAKQANKDG